MAQIPKATVPDPMTRRQVPARQVASQVDTLLSRVRAMRAAQKTYFEAHGAARQAALIECRRLEQLVDKLLEEIPTKGWITHAQMDMFSQEDK